MSDYNLITIITGIATLFLAFFSIFTMYNCLRLISPENRALPAWSAWLILIPFFGAFWNLIVIVKIDKSLQAEILQRHLKIKINRSFKYTGIVSSILSLVIFFLPQTSQELIFPVAILWITYWLILHMKVHELKLSKK